MEPLLEFNRVTFALPGRQFVVNASVTVNESLPKVTEFVLRLIRLCDGLEPGEIRAYFGLSAKETKIVLDSLADGRLVRFDEGLVKLTLYAADKFDETSDEIPRFAAIKERTDSIDFDLLTFHPIDGRAGVRSPGNMVELAVDDESIGSSARLAEHAYQRHFHRILRAKERSQDKIDIYKIAGVQGKKLFFLPVVARLMLDSDGEVVRNVDYGESAPEEFRLGIDTAVSNKLRRPIGLQLNLLEEFVERFEDKVLRQFLTKRKFDFWPYVQKVFLEKAISYGEATQAVFGNLYMPPNRAMLADWVAASFRDERADSRDAQHLFSSIAWLAPDYPLWGRTSLLDELIETVESRLPKPPKPRKLSTERAHVLYPATREKTRLVTNQFRGTREKSLHFFSGEVMGGRVEVFFLPAKFACVLFHFSLPGNSAAFVPFGFVSREPALVKEAQVIIMEAAAQGNTYLGPAEFKKDANPELAPVFNDHFGFVNYCTTW